MCCIYVLNNRDRYEIVSNVYNTSNTSSMQTQFESLTLCKKSIYLNAPSFFTSLPLVYFSLQRLSKIKVEIKRYLIHSRR